MSARWKDLERTAAAKLKGRRVHRRWDLFEKAADVLDVDGFDFIVECKAYRRFSHHTLLEAARRKYCSKGQTPLLVTKAEGQRGECVTLPLDTFAELLDRVRAHTPHHVPPRVYPPQRCTPQDAAYAEALESTTSDERDSSRGKYAPHCDAPSTGGRYPGRSCDAQATRSPVGPLPCMCQGVGGIEFESRPTDSAAKVPCECGPVFSYRPAGGKKR